MIFYTGIILFKYYTYDEAIYILCTIIDDFRFV